MKKDIRRRTDVVRALPTTKDPEICTTEAKFNRPGGNRHLRSRYSPFIRQPFTPLLKCLDFIEVANFWAHKDVYRLWCQAGVRKGVALLLTA